MFNQQQITLALSKIEEVSKLKTVEDDNDFKSGEFYNPSDGGNFDDTYADGVDTGRIEFARDLMALLTSDN